MNVKMVIVAAMFLIVGGIAGYLVRDAMVDKTGTQATSWVEAEAIQSAQLSASGSFVAIREGLIVIEQNDESYTLPRLAEGMGITLTASSPLTDADRQAVQEYNDKLVQYEKDVAAFKKKYPNVDPMMPMVEDENIRAAMPTLPTPPPFVMTYEVTSEPILVPGLPNPMGVSPMPLDNAVAKRETTTIAADELKEGDQITAQLQLGGAGAALAITDPANQATSERELVTMQISVTRGLD